MLDYLTSHKTEKNINELTCFRTNIATIPGGLTRFLQPLDLGVIIYLKLN